MQPDPDGDERAVLAPSARAPSRAARIRIGFGAAVGLLLLALAVAVGIGAFAPHGDSRTIAPNPAQTDQAGMSGRVTQASGAAKNGSTLFVHVLGAVAHPGLFELRDGDRVVDAIAAAGGFAAQADRSGVNLARVLSDGEQLRVPKVGEVLPETSPGAAGGVAGPGAKAGRKVNLNSATEAELETLPRIGPAMAQRIIAWRTENGRFTRTTELMNVTGIGQKTFDSLKDLITI